MVIDFLLQGIGKPLPYYLELGVYHPRNGSNTYKFYVRGAKGVLVEADGSLIKGIKAERPDDKVLHYGVNIGHADEAIFYVFDEPSVNTFDKVEAERRHLEGKHKIVRRDTVILKSLDRILAEDCDRLPDFLSIDIEGLDYDVLKNWDAEKFTIPIVCAETCLYSNTHIKGKDDRVITLMNVKGYFVYADTYINTIFVHRSWFLNYKK